MKFVTAFNGARDYYEVPLALQQIGRLERHVSDFYLPEIVASLAGAAGLKAANRNRIGLPISRVTMVFPAALRQMPISARSLSAMDYQTIDRILSNKAADIAEAKGAGLFLHNNYAYWAFERCQDRPRWLYQYHPHARYVQDLLAQDVARFPEVTQSFSTETDSQIAPTSGHFLDEWSMADHIFCASDFTAQSLVAQGCDRRRIHVVSYGGNFSPNWCETKRTSNCQFLFVGQGVQRKGLHHLLRVWNSLDIDGATLTIVARRLDPGLRRFVSHPTIRYLPGVPNLELKRLFQESDVFVMPSLVEGFGLVYLEALAAGLHCIGTNNTGLPDLQLPSAAASIIPAGDLDALAESMLNVRQLWGRGLLSKANVRSTAKFWSWERHQTALRDEILKYDFGV